MASANNTLQHRLQEAAHAFQSISALAECAMRDLDLDVVPTAGRTTATDGEREQKLRHENNVLRELNDELRRENDVLRTQDRDSELRRENEYLRARLASTRFAQQLTSEQVDRDSEMPSTLHTKELVSEAIHSMPNFEEGDSQNVDHGLGNTRRSVRQLDSKIKVSAHHTIFNEHHTVIISFSLLSGLCVLITCWNDTLGLVQSWDNGGYGPLGFYWEVIALAIFGTEILSTFNTSYEDKNGRAVESRLSIAKHYLKTWFLIDCATTIPWGLLELDSMGGARFVKILKLAKMARAAKILKLLANESAGSALDLFDALMSIITPEDSLDFVLMLKSCSTSAVMLCIVLLLEGHILSCVLLSNAEGGGLSWEYHGLEPIFLTRWTRYLVAMRWSIMACLVGMTPDSMVQLAPFDAGSQLFQTIIVLWHSANLLGMMAIFGNTKGSDDASLSHHALVLKMYVRQHRGVSRAIRNSVSSFLRTALKQADHNTVVSTMCQLPTNLKRSLTKELYYPCISEFMLFMQEPCAELGSFSIASELCDLVESRCYSANDIVISKGTEYGGMFWVYSGNLVIESLHSPTDVEIEESDMQFIGVEALFAPATDLWQVTSWSFKAVRYSTVLVLQRTQFERAIASNLQQCFWVQSIRDAVSSGRLDITSLQYGLDESTWNDFKANLAAQMGSDSTKSENLGVSLQYLLQEFKGDVEAQLHEVPSVAETVDDDHNGIGHLTFLDLKTHFWGDNHAGFKGSATHICPRDNLEGSAIVDVLEDACKGEATHFVSWCWLYRIDMVISALDLWASTKSMDHSEVFLWMCFFCNNQRKLLINQVEVDNLSDTFASRLRKIGHMIILLDAYQSSFYTTRVWCVYETYEATQHGIPIDVSLPEVSRQEFYNRLESGRFNEIADGLKKIHVESARASVEKDEVHIKSVIRNTIGFAAVNRTVQFALMNWLALAFQHHLEQFTISDVAAHIFYLLSGKRAKSVSHTDTVRYIEWEAAVQRHPALLEFLEVEAASARDAFEAFDLNAAGELSMHALSKHIQSRGKSDLKTLLTSKLLQQASGDRTLKVMLNQVEDNFRHRVAELEEQLSEDRLLLDGLEQLSPVRSTRTVDSI